MGYGKDVPSFRTFEVVLVSVVRRTEVGDALAAAGAGSCVVAVVADDHVRVEGGGVGGILCMQMDTRASALLSSLQRDCCASVADKQQRRQRLEEVHLDRKAWIAETSRV